MYTIQGLGKCQWWVYLYWVKMSNGEFDFYFCTIYRNYFKKWVFNLQFLIFIKIKLMPCHVYLMKQVQGYSKLFSTHIGQDFDNLYAFLHLYLIRFTPKITILTTDYGILTFSTLSISLFFRGQGFPNMSTLAQNTFIVFGTNSAFVIGSGEPSQLFFMPN